MKKFTFDGRPKFNIDGGCKPYIVVTDVREKKDVPL
jgi:hypothetical protein